MENKKNEKQKKMFIEPIAKKVEFDNLDIIKTSGNGGNPAEQGIE